jgi:DNA repair ATPase RecN
MDARTKFVEELSAEMVEWDNQIERIREKIKDAEPAAKAQYQKTIDELQQKRDQAAQKLQTLHSADDDDWEEMKKGAEQIWKEMKAMLQERVRKH